LSLATSGGTLTRAVDKDPVRFGYACGALRVTTDERSESTGPRAHVVGFLKGLQAVGVEPRVYLAGDNVPARAAAPGSGKLIAQGRARRVAMDLTRIGLRYELRRRAWRAIGSVDVLYERQATFQDIGRAFRRRGARWIVESNGPFWYEADHERKSLAFVRLARRLELNAYRDADLVIAVSEPLKEIIVRESGRSEDDIYVLPNATDATRFDPAATSARRLAAAPTIGFAGYMTQWAGLDNLIWVLASLRARGRNLSAVLIGDGPHRAQLEAQAREEGVAERIHFTGNVPWVEIPALLAGLDMAFSGQRKMSIGAMYHSPQKLYEYQAMGLPVIASDHPDARRLLADTPHGWLFEPDDRAELLRTLETALDDGTLSERGASARQALLQAHTWEIRVTQLLAELEVRGLLAAEEPRLNSLATA
jgi:glycosyltransferase involved in cell wall biosynthesis